MNRSCSDSMSFLNEVLNKYRNSLAKEGFIKSLIWGCIIGFSLMTVLSVVFYLNSIYRQKTKF